jgi:hypothetical protein
MLSLQGTKRAAESSSKGNVWSSTTEQNKTRLRNPKPKSAKAASHDRTHGRPHQLTSVFFFCIVAESVD